MKVDLDGNNAVSHCGSQHLSVSIAATSRVPLMCQRAPDSLSTGVFCPSSSLGLEKMVKKKKKKNWARLSESSS